MANAERLKAAIIGCGNISGIYFTNLTQTFKGIVDLTACADLDMKRARGKAKEFGVKAMTVEQVMKDKAIKVIVNLTIPKAHHPVAIEAVKNGKHVYNEKPLCITQAEGEELLAAATKKKVRVSCAPDTFLGGGIQTCLKLINDGWIGTPVSATAFMQCHGHESWHPDPEFYYKPGGGPMFDMGPYYLTALVALMGPVQRVTGITGSALAERTITADLGKFGQKVKVEVPTHIAGVMNFASGAIANIITSFDVWSHTLPCIEIHGTDGSMIVPDPNCFGGKVKIRRPDMEDWMPMPLSHSYAENSRGIGVADMVRAALTGRDHRANGELAFHVLDLMHSFHDASDSGRHIKLKSSCRQPKPLPSGLLPGVLD